MQCEKDVFDCSVVCKEHLLDSVWYVSYLVSVMTINRRWIVKTTFLACECDLRERDEEHYLHVVCDCQQWNSFLGWCRASTNSKSIDSSISLEFSFSTRATTSNRVHSLDRCWHFGVKDDGVVSDSQKNHNLLVNVSVVDCLDLCLLLLTMTDEVHCYCWRLSNVSWSFQSMFILVRVEKKRHEDRKKTIREHFSDQARQEGQRT